MKRQAPFCWEWGSPGSLLRLASFCFAPQLKLGAPELRLVQFVGPVKRAWLEQLEASGFETDRIRPNNGYLCAADSNLAPG